MSVRSDATSKTVSESPKTKPQRRAIDTYQLQKATNPAALLYRPQMRFPTRNRNPRFDPVNEALVRPVPAGLDSAAGLR